MQTLLSTFIAAGLLAAAPVPEALRPALTLHASFDKGINADVAKADGRLFSAPDYKQQADAQPGFGKVDASIEKDAGIGGSDALHFKSKNTRALFFRGNRHVSPARGTLSFWLRVDPQKDLAPGFCDPVQVTDKAYNDSAIWVDFTKDDVPRHFRLGVFGQLKAWNPANTPPDTNPAFTNRLVVVERPPFAADKWTHVAMTWSGLGTAQGTAALYLDGKLISSSTGITELFEWDASRVAIRLGVNYVGLMDEVAVFNRALTPHDIGTLSIASGSQRHK